jgi:tetratricopeptide (TPR) repeat protein
MGDLLWELQLQSGTMQSILEAVQSPLDTAGTELRRRAEEAYRNGWHEEALGDLLESERKNYQDFTVHRLIGNLYLYHLVDLPKALEYLRKAAKYSRPRSTPMAAAAHYCAGVVCGLLQSFADGFAEMSQATELNPEFYEAFYMQAAFAALCGRAAGHGRESYKRRRCRPALPRARSNGQGLRPSTTAGGATSKPIHPRGLRLHRAAGYHAFPYVIRTGAPSLPALAARSSTSPSASSRSPA